MLVKIQPVVGVEPVDRHVQWGVRWRWGDGNRRTRDRLGTEREQLGEEGGRLVLGSGDDDAPAGEWLRPLVPETRGSVLPNLSD
ncbi:MAG: hypothetical protein JO023_06255 [Chloroflexi bacterium]|nr:hypothetical protein [Chloroflexota bacterium]